MNAPLRVLAIDTTSTQGSIALVDVSGVIEMVAMESPEGFGHVVFGEIDALLARHKMDVGDIDAFASASGPGSFTGVRIGLTAVKGLAEATGKPVMAISNLQALAWHGTAEYRATIIDARRGEIFGAVYSSGLEIVRDEVVIRLDAWLTELNRHFPGSAMEKVEFIAQGIALGELVPGRVMEAPRSLAEAVGQIALRGFREGRGQDTALINANYVRRSDAELLWRDPVKRSGPD